MSTISKAVLTKKTKAQILEEFEDLRQELERVKKEQLPLPAREARKKEEEEILQKTAERTPAVLETEVAVLKKKLISSLMNCWNRLYVKAVFLVICVKR